MGTCLKNVYSLISKEAENSPDSHSYSSFYFLQDLIHLSLILLTSVIHLIKNSTSDLDAG